MSMPRGDTHAFGVNLFGGPRVEAADGPVRLSPLQLALVALVYGHGKDGIARPRAARLLWGREADTDARHRLRQLLLDIRRRAGGALIDARGDSLCRSNGVTCDLVHFEASLAKGALHEAAALARSNFAHFAPGLVSDAFSDWGAGVHADLLRRLRGRASAKWSRETERSDWEAARDAAEALYLLDSLNLDAIERVIEARGRVGDLEAAESAYAALVESGPASEEALDRAFGAIRHVRRLTTLTQRGRVATDRPPLVGRREALQTARSLFDQLNAGRFGFVLISGESGIGKTRLLQELEREVVFRGYRCLTAQAVELESRIPLNPLLDALKGVDLGAHLEALGQPWSAVIGAVLPPGAVDQRTGELPHIQESALPRRLLDAFALLLQGLAREQPTVLFIDDLQWADATTIAALQFVQRRWSGGPLGIMATVRPDLVRADDPVAKYLSRADGLALQRIELHELTMAEGLQLVSHLGRGKIEEQQGRRICALSGLHPLYLTELTRDYLAGRLNLPDLPAVELMIPVSLAQILEARLRYLDSRSMKVAGLLAVGAKPMPAATLATLAGFSLDDAAEAIDALHNARLVEIEWDRARIAHELFRSAIYRHIGEPRRVIYHRAIAAQLLSDGADDAPGELATHYARAGEAELAAKYGWRAADRAMETGAVAEAAHLYQVVADNERDESRRADATAGVARALHLGRDISRAIPMLELAANRLRASGKAGDALRLEITRIEGIADVGAVPLTALSEGLSRLKQQAADGCDWEAVALALDVELHLLHRAGDVPGIRRLFDDMRVVAKKGCVEATLLTHAGLALGVLFGDPDEALSAARRAVSLTDERRTYRLRALIRLMVVLQYRGMLELPSSAPIIEEARALSKSSGDVLLRFSIESNLAVALLDAGDVERAEGLMASPTVAIGAADMDLNRCIQANNRAELALAQRDFVRSTHAFAEAASYLGPTSPSYLEELISAGLGLCALETGDLREARQREHQLRDAPPSWHFDPTTILAFRVRLLDRRARHDEAIALLESSATDLEGRLVLAWLKVRALQARLMIKRNVGGAKAIALDARNRAEELCLSYRAREFAELLGAPT